MSDIEDLPEVEEVPESPSNGAAAYGTAAEIERIARRHAALREAAEAGNAAAVAEIRSAILTELLLSESI